MGVPNSTQRPSSLPFFVILALAAAASWAGLAEAQGPVLCELEENVFVPEGSVCDAFCNGPGCAGLVSCTPGVDCPAPPADATEAAGNGFCLTPGSYACEADGTNTVCLAPPELEIYTPEGEAGGGDPTCFDGIDNDCDGLLDQEEVGCPPPPEICDGIDNDGDGEIDEGFFAGGVAVGQLCTAGTGACRNTSTVVCSADGQSAVCPAVAGFPGVEGPFGTITCSDGIDNDCDGLIDGGDLDSCFLPSELCDGIDNTGDGVIDEGFDVGAACSTGPSVLGVCQAQGVKICNAAGTGTVCNAVAGLPAIEGPSRPASCGDDLDNDCDGFIDEEDPSCGAVELGVSCSLRFFDPPGRGRGRPGRDCNSWHYLEYDVRGVDLTAPGTKVTKELLAVGLDGTILDAILVDDGDIAHMASRVDAEDFKLKTVVNAHDVVHDIFAPIPVYRVTVTDGLREASAYCSSIPYLQVVEPTGGVISLNETALSEAEDVLPVTVALPLVDPQELEVKVDGVDVFAALGIADPATCTSSFPCSGSYLSGGLTIDVTDLVVDVAPDVESMASNTLSMKVGGLGCGGHVVSVMGEQIPGAMPRRVARSCHVDDLADRGTSFTFDIDITHPVSQQTNVPVPTLVEGRVCHGLPIESVSVNGLEIFDPAELTVLPGDGVDTLDTFEFTIETELGQTSVARDLVAGDAPFGTFDPGTNFVQAAASDALGSRAFNSAVAFSTGSTALPAVGAVPPPAGLALASTSTDVFQPGVDTLVEDELKAMVRDTVRSAAMMTMADSISVPNAFVVGLKKQAIANFFQNKCEGDPSDPEPNPIEKFAVEAEAALRGRTFGPVSAPFPCSCDPRILFSVTDVQIDTSDFSCPIFFPSETDQDGDVVGNDRFRVFLNLPDVKVSIAGSDSCRDEVLGVCISKASASVSADFEVKDIALEFDITESQLMGNVGPNATFHAGVSGVLENTINATSSVGCIGGAFCEALITVFTFGTVDVTPNISIDTALDFAAEIGQGEPDPIRLGEIKVDEETVANFEQTLAGDLVDVDISPAGIRASLNGRFATEFLDPEIVATPGTLLTPAPPPTPDAGNAQDGFVVVADDTLNMLFAGMTLSGRLKSECISSTDPDTGQPRTIGSLLPDDCESVGGTNPTGASLAQGLCHGISGTACESLAGPSFFTTPIEQGTCHGLQGADCSMVATGFDGIVLPSDCSDIVFGAGDTDDPSRSQAIAQGRCFGLRGAVCETLATGSGADTAAMQGACHAVQGADCTALPVDVSPNVERGTCLALQGTACADVSFLERPSCLTTNFLTAATDSVLRLAEQQACNLTPAVNVTASDTVLFCARQDVPPSVIIRDDAATDPVEIALRTGDLSLGIVVDRDGAGPDGDFTSLPSCLGAGSVASGDCSLASLCLDLNIIAGVEIAADECPAGGGLATPGFAFSINEIQQLNRQAGLVCSGLPAGDDATFVNQATTANASLDIVRMNADVFAPPACIEGLSLGGFVTFVDPNVLAIKTGSLPSVCENDLETPCTSDAQCGGSQCIDLQDYLGLTTTIQP